MLAAALAALVAPAAVQAQSGRPDLTNLTIEDLMHIEITSASRKEERVADVAAAVFVITREDIRRSGMTTIPDLLRLVPGVEVAQLNANKWAVSIRGFNAVYATKLLVLVDGRSIYNPIFAGVIWEDEDLMLDDVDRIEVIRGPGAAIWGANAVNGVINIVTKPTADTQGGLVRVDAGRTGEQGAVRYGGTRGALSYRLYSQWSGRTPSVTEAGARAGDPSHSDRTGFRADWTARPGAFMLQGDFTAGHLQVLWPNLDPLTLGREPLVIPRGGGVGRQSQHIGLIDSRVELRAIGAVVEAENLRKQNDPVEIERLLALQRAVESHETAGLPNWKWHMTQIAESRRVCNSIAATEVDLIGSCDGETADVLDHYRLSTSVYLQILNN
jgi:outer membrane receptor protein involved in Fe transport